VAWVYRPLKTFKTLKNIKIVKQHRAKGIFERGPCYFCCSDDIYLRREERTRFVLKRKSAMRKRIGRHGGYRSIPFRFLPWQRLYSVWTCLPYRREESQRHIRKLTRMPLKRLFRTSPVVYAIGGLPCLTNKAFRASSWSS